MKGKESFVCKLKHSLYGLKQSLRCWNNALDTHLKRNGFVQSSNDPLLQKESHYLWVSMSMTLYWHQAVRNEFKK